MPSPRNTRAAVSNVGKNSNSSSNMLGCLFPFLWRMLPVLGFIFLATCLMSFSVTHHHLTHLEQSNPIMDARSSFSSGGAAAAATKSNTRQAAATTTARTAAALNDGSTVITSIEYPVEEPIPNIEPPADGNATFSSCMLLMDDNHRLAEWFAYHYHVLPLRYMVVTVDPRSKTSPTWLLNRWRRMGVYIEEWTDLDYWKPLAPIPEDARFQVKRDRHRGRQKYFYKKCLIHLKERNRTWVALHDSDEYLVYNHAGGDKFEAWEAKMVANHDQSKVEGDPTGNKKRIRPAHTPPTTGQEGAMIDYIRHEQAAKMINYQSPCIGVPRLQFGTNESTSKELNDLVPEGFDAEIFDTLRWRKHAPRNDFYKNSLGKVIMDVSRIDVANSPRFYSLHRPIKTICTAPWHNDWDSGLRINHYLGSWESYTFRDDSRRGGERSREMWEYRGFTNDEESDDNIRPWLEGFVHRHGTTRAKELLQNVGIPRNYRNPLEAEYNMAPDKLFKILKPDENERITDRKRINFEEWVRDKYRKDNLLEETISRLASQLEQETKEQVV
jgi:hypothetical protein